MVWSHTPSGPMQQSGQGLPFAGVPDELAKRVQDILDTEPRHPPSEVEFSQSSWDRRPLTLRTTLRPRLGWLLLSFLLVAAETLAIQSIPFLTKVAIDDGITQGDTGTLLRVGILAALAVGAQALFGWGRIAATARLGENITKDLRVRVFSHVQRLSLGFFTNEKAGRILSRMTSDIENLTHLFQEGLVSIALQVLTMVVVTAILLGMDVGLAVLTLVLVIPPMTLLTLWYQRASDQAFNDVRDRIADVIANLAENLAGIRVLTAMNRRLQNDLVHRNVAGTYRDANYRTAQINAIYGPTTEVIGVLAQAIVLVAGGAMVASGSMTVGVLTAFVLYLTQFFAPIQQLVQLHTVYQQGRASIDKLDDVLATEPDVAEAPDAADLPPIRGDITLHGVTFGYEPSTPVLRDVDLEIRPGETFALVGPTGSGKSTIAKLVARFYDPDEGVVRVDGTDVRTVTFHSLRRQLGVVPQEPFLFHGTIGDNVAFGRPEATDDEVSEACEAVGLDDLLERLPAGLDTPVHERGSSLSAGERQLLSLARAFLSRPRVLVLDEATSNLDPRAERRVEAALDRLVEGRTAIVVAHRLSTASRADRIGVVHEGRVVEIGSHDELLAADGPYAAGWRAWVEHAGE